MVLARAACSATARGHWRFEPDADSDVVERVAARRPEGVAAQWRWRDIPLPAHLRCAEHPRQYRPEAARPEGRFLRYSPRVFRVGADALGAHASAAGP